MKIAIVEDEALIAMELADIVEDAGHTVIGPFRSLEEAVDLRDDDAPELAFVDLRLGNRRCGAKIDAYLFERFGTTSVYVTGNRDFAFRYRTYAIGFIEKPAFERTIIETITYMAQRRRGLAPAQPPGGLNLFEDRCPRPEAVGIKATKAPDAHARFALNLVRHS